jgi:hypothetical protein
MGVNRLQTGGNLRNSTMYISLAERLIDMQHVNTLPFCFNSHIHLRDFSFRRYNNVW